MKFQQARVCSTNLLSLLASCARSPVLWLVLALLSCIPASRAERSDRNQPIQLEADRVTIDDARQVSVFEGSVTFAQGTIMIRGDMIVVTQGRDGLKHSTVTGEPASFRQKRENSDEYVEGYAGRIEYDSNSTIVNLYGQARIRRGQDEVRGEHISYNSRTEQFRAHGGSSGDADGAGDGRVRVIIQPKNTEAPPDSGSKP